MGVLSQSTTNSPGPINSGNGNITNDDHTNVVATLSQHASAAMPVASLAVSPNRSPLTTNSNAINTIPLSTKQFLIRRVRSRSKSDPEAVPEKSLFSRFFPKKTKKPLPTLITTSSKSIDRSINSDPNNKDSKMLTSPRRSVHGGYDEEEDEFDERVISTNSLSDTDQQHSKENRTIPSQSSTVSRAGIRTTSGNNRYSTAGPNALSLPSSDSQYYASMTSAPTGFSISYHKCMSRGGDDLRIQATLGRMQKNRQTGTGAANQLLVSCMVEILFVSSFYQGTFSHQFSLFKHKLGGYFLSDCLALLVLFTAACFKCLRHGHD